MSPWFQLSLSFEIVGSLVISVYCNKVVVSQKTNFTLLGGESHVKRGEKL